MRPNRSFLRREGVLGIGHLIVFLFYQCIAFCISYATDDIGGVVRELITQS